MKGQKYKRNNDLDSWKNDSVYTPDWLAEKICNMYKINGDVLEPCKGEGVFMKYLPKNSDWCEIKQGKDFYQYKKNVDWIVTNPPYSHFDKFLEHCFLLSKNVVLLVPCSKFFTSIGKLRLVFNYGNFKEIHILAYSKAGFPFGFPSGVFFLEKGYKGKCEIKMLDGIEQAGGNVTQQRL